MGGAYGVSNYANIYSGTYRYYFWGLRFDYPATALGPTFAVNAMDFVSAVTGSNAYYPAWGGPCDTDGILNLDLRGTPFAIHTSWKHHTIAGTPPVYLINRTNANQTIAIPGDPEVDGQCAGMHYTLPENYPSLRFGVAGWPAGAAIGVFLYPDTPDDAATPLPATVTSQLLCPQQARIAEAVVCTYAAKKAGGPIFVDVTPANVYAVARVTIPAEGLQAGSLVANVVFTSGDEFGMAYSNATFAPVVPSIAQTGRVTVTMMRGAAVALSTSFIVSDLPTEVVVHCAKIAVQVNASVLCSARPARQGTPIFAPLGTVNASLSSAGLGSIGAFVPFASGLGSQIISEYRFNFTAAASITSGSVTLFYSHAASGTQVQSTPYPLWVVRPPDASSTLQCTPAVLPLPAIREAAVATCRLETRLASNSIHFDPVLLPFTAELSGGLRGRVVQDLARVAASPSFDFSVAFERGPYGFVVFKESFNTTAGPPTSYRWSITGSAALSPEDGALRLVRGAPSEGMFVFEPAGPPPRFFTASFRFMSINSLTNGGTGFTFAYGTARRINDTFNGPTASSAPYCTGALGCLAMQGDRLSGAHRL
eukprot:tig00021234_g19432.t1